MLQKDTDFPNQYSWARRWGQYWERERRGKGVGGTLSRYEQKSREARLRSDNALYLASKPCATSHAIAFRENIPSE